MQIRNVKSKGDKKSQQKKTLQIKSHSIHFSQLIHLSLSFLKSQLMCLDKKYHKKPGALHNNYILLLLQINKKL